MRQKGATPEEFQARDRPASLRDYKHRRAAGAHDLAEVDAAPEVDEPATPAPPKGAETPPPDGFEWGPTF